MKANASLAVLKTFADAGVGFDIVSAGELARVIGASKRPDEMRAALQAGVECFNVESEAEPRTLARLASALNATGRVSQRVNPDVDAGTYPQVSIGLKGNKFGVAHEQARAVYAQAARRPGLLVAGIDGHIGSQITDTSPHLDALDRLLDLIEQIEADGTTIHHLDLGSDLGITGTDERPPAADVFVAELLARIAARGHGHREIRMEPGRAPPR